MSAAEAVAAFISPLLAGWIVQVGRWDDAAAAKTDRFAVVRPAGGPKAELVRRPEFTLMLIGAAGEAVKVPFEAAEVVIEAMRNSSGSLVFMQASEPVYHPTRDGRPIAELAVSTLTT